MKKVHIELSKYYNSYFFTAIFKIEVIFRHFADHNNLLSNMYKWINEKLSKYRKLLRTYFTHLNIGMYIIASFSV